MSSSNHLSPSVIVIAVLVIATAASSHPLLLKDSNKSFKNELAVTKSRLVLPRQSNIALGPSLVVLINLLLAVPQTLVLGLAFLARSLFPILRGLVLQVPIILFNLVAKVFTLLARGSFSLLQVLSFLARVPFRVLAVAVRIVIGAPTIVAQAVVLSVGGLAQVIGFLVRALLVQIPTAIVGALAPIMAGLIAFLSSVLQALLIGLPTALVNFLGPVWIWLGNALTGVIQAVLIQIPRLILQSAALLVRMVGLTLAGVVRLVIIQLPRLLSRAVVLAVAVVVNSTRMILTALASLARSVLLTTNAGSALVHQLVGNVISLLLVALMQVGNTFVRTFSITTLVAKSVLDQAVLLVYRLGFSIVRSLGFSLQFVNAVTGQLASNVLLGAANGRASNLIHQS